MVMRGWAWELQSVGYKTETKLCTLCSIKSQKVSRVRIVAQTAHYGPSFTFFIVTSYRNGQ